jgi:hypothetical protein
VTAPAIKIKEKGKGERNKREGEKEKEIQLSRNLSLFSKVCSIPSPILTFMRKSSTVARREPILSE